MLDGVIRRDARRWGREASLGTRPAGQARPTASLRGEHGRRRSRNHRRSHFDLRLQGTGTRKPGRKPMRAPGRGQAQRAVAHSELFIGRFAGELNGSDARDTASSRNIRRQTADLEGVPTRALSVGRFTMETHPLLTAGPRHDFRCSNRRLPVAARDANADAGARLARGTRARAPAWPGASPNAGVGIARWPGRRRGRGGVGGAGAGRRAWRRRRHRSSDAPQ